jgi:hypothetical protein
MARRWRASARLTGIALRPAAGPRGRATAVTVAQLRSATLVFSVTRCGKALGAGRRVQVNRELLDA